MITSGEEDNKTNAMMLLLTSVTLILSIVSSVSSSTTPFIRGISRVSANGAIFGIRGGGLFGGKENEKYVAMINKKILHRKKI